MLFVRFEKRPGDEEEHACFVAAPTGAHIVTRWYPKDATLDEYELVHDTRGRQEAIESFREMRRAERERDAMVAAMTRAMSLLTEEEAREIRGVYREAVR